MYINQINVLDKNMQRSESDLLYGQDNAGTGRGTRSESRSVVPTSVVMGAARQSG